MNRHAIGIDIGGTAVKLGLMHQDGTLVGRHVLDFDREMTFERLIALLADACRALQSDTGVLAAAIGVATPGYSDPETGIAVDGAHNVPCLERRSVPRALTEALGVPAVVENDGIAATLGELHFGKGRGLDRFALLTIGTGVGGGVVVGGRVVTGFAGEPAELGAIVLDPEGPRNYSGLSGTLEAFAAVPGLIDAYAAHGGGGAATPKAIFAAAANGESAALAAIDEICRPIAQAFGTMINILNLQACIIGGGVSAAGAPLLERVRQHLPDFTWPLLLSRCTLNLAANLNEAGVKGAAISALLRG